MNNEVTIEYNIPKGIEAKVRYQIKSADEAYDRLVSRELGMTGWIDYPLRFLPDLYDRIDDMARKIKKHFSAIVIIGIGGSYIGTHAALDFLGINQGKSTFNKSTPKIFFGGINLSSDYHEKIIKALADEDPALLIVSKSGGTTETVAAMNLFIEYLEKIYGENNVGERVFVITDPQNGRLRELSDEKSYPTLPIPDNIGGRFSFLTAVGLLPMAVAGFDIRKIIEGAVLAGKSDMIQKAKTLASVRNTFESSGYSVELFAGFEPYLTNLIEWIKQLYGESEGKNGKGMFPVTLEYSKDLHSLGQFVQEGRQTFTETIISVKNYNSNTNLTELNDIAKRGVMAAHSSSGIPVTQIQIPSRDEYSLGQVMYLLQMSCAIRGIMMGINPFDQPGVEKYKEEMRKIQGV